MRALALVILVVCAVVRPWAQTLVTVLHPGETPPANTRHIAPEAGAEPLVLNLPQRMLFLRSGEELFAYPIAVGRPTWPTPVGSFRVIAKEEDPTWDVPLSIQEEMRQLGQPVVTRVAPGPGNPLGAFFIRLSFESVGIHGTNAPSSIYRAVTHGCIRLAPADIAELYPRVGIGMQGRIVYEPVLLAVENGRVWLEAHPDIYRRAPAPLAAARRAAAAIGATDRVDWQLAADVLNRQAGIAIDVTSSNGSGY